MKELRVTFIFKDGTIGPTRYYKDAFLAVEAIKDLYAIYREPVHRVEVNGVQFKTVPGVRALRKLLGTTA